MFWININKGLDECRAVIFDLDGTILNTIEDLTDSTNHVLAEYGCPEHTLEEVCGYVGDGIRRLIERAVPQGTDAERIEEMYRAFLAYYQDHCMIKTRPYEGIPELLKLLREAGLMTAVVSNKADAAVKELAEQMYPGCFDYAGGARDGVPLKPDPAMVAVALDEMGVSADEAVYVGDSQVDIETARNAHMPCIGVTWGFRGRKVLLGAGAQLLADDAQELGELILRGAAPGGGGRVSGSGGRGTAKVH